MPSDNPFDELERVGEYTCKHCGEPYVECSACEEAYCVTCWPDTCPRTSWHPGHAHDDAERGRRWMALEAMRRHARERARRVAELRATCPRCGRLVVEGVLCACFGELPGNPARCPLCGSSSPCDCPF